MKTIWDYTNLADAYVKRPDYALEAITSMLQIAGVQKGDTVLDVGAGAAHLTRHLVKAGLQVHAVEPNDAMRAHGIERTREFPNVSWYEGVGEHTGQPANSFRLVTFGSSFNVTRRNEALAEAHRVLQADGWFACLWNHRDLKDSLQKEIENYIQQEVPYYAYGSRREDPTKVIDESGLFNKVIPFVGRTIHKIATQDFIEAWESHGTLERQAKERFSEIVKGIATICRQQGTDILQIPYITHGWMARVKK